MIGLLRRHVPLLCAIAAWAGRCAVCLTDWIIESAMAQLGEPILWEDVERLAQAKIEEEQRKAVERWKALRGAKPALRLVSKP